MKKKLIAVVLVVIIIVILFAVFSYLGGYPVGFKNGRFLIKNYFCSDVCPAYGHWNTVYSRIKTQADCDKIGGRSIIDPAWGGFEGCAPITLVEYRNAQYGFTFSLPETWKGFSIITDKWEGYDLTKQYPQGQVITEQGPMISIRHPQWTAQVPRQDIPIMVFTIDQWGALNKDEFHIGAAPINPSELGRNDKYVFALPARYNYAYPEGYQEVDEILSKGSLHTF